MSSMTPPPERATAARWRARPVLSAVLRVVVFVMPIVAALGLSFLVGRVFPRPPDLAGAILWWLVFLLVEVLAFATFQRLAQRLIPLATLLRLSLLFPDRAPSRFAVARRRVRDLESETAWTRAPGVADAPARATETIVTLVAALTAHDRATRGHSERVRIFTDMVADELKLPPDARDRLRWAALLHDIGKLSVPATVLNKRGDPGPEGWKTLRQHPVEGARLIEPIREWLGEWALAVEQHHERWDGKGYPKGLRGREISLGARIVAVVDAFETMTAARPYKRPMGVAAARRELVRSSGTHLDPTLVRAFLTISIGRLWRTVGFTAWLAPLAGAPLGLVPRLLPAGSGAAGVTALVTTGTLAVHPAVLPTQPPATPAITAPARTASPSPASAAGTTTTRVPSSSQATSVTSTVSITRAESSTASSTTHVTSTSPGQSGSTTSTTTHPTTSTSTGTTTTTDTNSTSSASTSKSTTTTAPATSTTTGATSTATGTTTSLVTTTTGPTTAGTPAATPAITP
ncbi:MAG TPA: HD domain-containing phosphohydrolase [Candidatus Dormibacteraeota bacterium]|jgi:putative nucleotidyltransferase with HDIG domain|nr:HD domain-containing phosphohydrolase [Candidatus Dormibacteraeota bacterium]